MIGVQPYIAFKGNAREAIEFYKQALGAHEIHAETYGNSPMAEYGPADAIMHATIAIGDSHVMMCDDMRPQAEGGASGNISLAIGLDDADAARRYFDNLSRGGEVMMPLDKTFWAEAFGMLTDKFGVKWMVNRDAPHEADKAAA